MKPALEGTVALVTGASSGIGAATATALAGHGAAVALAARRRRRLETLAAGIRDQGGTALVLEADVTDQQQAAGTVQRTVAELGRLDTLINNAGVMLLGPAVGAPLVEWQQEAWTRRRMVSVDDELRAELLERAGRDQAAREALPSEHGMRGWAEIVEPVDRANTARMREIVGEHGWPGHQLVGEEGAHAAWLLVQHAPPEFQEQCLPLLEEASARGDASPRDVAYLTDRVLLHRGEPQIYGTQYTIRDGVLTLWPVQDPEGLDGRRAALGLEPEAQNRARMLAPREDQPGPG